MAVKGMKKALSDNVQVYVINSSGTVTSQTDYLYKGQTVKDIGPSVEPGYRIIEYVSKDGTERTGVAETSKLSVNPGDVNLPEPKKPEAPKELKELTSEELLKTFASYPVKYVTKDDVNVRLASDIDKIVGTKNKGQAVKYVGPSSNAGYSVIATLVVASDGSVRISRDAIYTTFLSDSPTAVSEKGKKSNKSDLSKIPSAVKKEIAESENGTPEKSDDTTTITKYIIGTAAAIVGGLAIKSFLESRNKNYDGAEQNAQGVAQR